MNILDRFWLDLILCALAIVFLNGAITGNFYSHGRGGGPKLIASVKPFGARIGFLIVSIGMFLWLVLDLWHKI
jgi:hypothetical protein